MLDLCARPSSQVAAGLHALRAVLVDACGEAADCIVDAACRATVCARCAGFHETALHAAARELLRRVDALVVPSARVIPQFAALGIDPASIEVVENGVDTASLEQLPDPTCGPGPLRLGYFGTLMPSKGLDVLLDAVLQLPEGTVELHVHGNAVPYHGDEGFLTRVFSLLSPGDRVTYHGPYTGHDLPALLAGIDVLAAPALWHEAFGLTVREALAAGRPVVVSRIGGLEDAIDDDLAP